MIINWEIQEDLDIISVHDKNVSLIGSDEKDVDYTAIGVVSCGELVNVYSIEIFKK